MISELISTLKNKRLSQGMSQRELAKASGLSQSHISQIESGSQDLSLSTLTAIARALDYEPMLVPRKLLPAVGSILADPKTKPANHSALDNDIDGMKRLIKKFYRTHGPNIIFDRLTDNLDFLRGVRLKALDLEVIKNLADQLKRYQASPQSENLLLETDKSLQSLRNYHAHSSITYPRPAYALGDDDE